MQIWFNTTKTITTTIKYIHINKKQVFYTLNSNRQGKTIHIDNNTKQSTYNKQGIHSAYPNIYSYCQNFRDNPETWYNPVTSKKRIRCVATSVMASPD
jgi:hypothetical protein